MAAINLHPSPTLRLSAPSSLSRRLLLHSLRPAAAASSPRLRLFAAVPKPTAALRHQRLLVYASSSTTSTPAKPTILVSEKLGAAGIALLNDFANVELAYNLSHEELCAKISLCDALIVRSGTKVNRAVFEASGGRLKVVGRAGVGIDNVDLAAATEHGCLVVNAPTANTIAAAEHAIALIAAMARNVAQADASLKAENWLQILIDYL